MKCKDCTYFWKMATPEYGGCSLMGNVQMVKAESNCTFLHKGKLTCGDCERLGNDTACMIADAEDDASSCCGFIPLGDSKIYNGLFELLKIGMYSREHIAELLDQFESERIFTFIEEHRDEE